MSLTYRQTISDELAALVEQRRGPISVQDFTTMALFQACMECATCRKLEAEIERLHQTLRSNFAVSLPKDDELSWD